MNFLADTPRMELFRIGGIPVRVDVTFALVPLFLFGTCSVFLTSTLEVISGPLSHRNRSPSARGCCTLS